MEIDFSQPFAVAAAHTVVIANKSADSGAAPPDVGPGARRGGGFLRAIGRLMNR